MGNIGVSYKVIDGKRELLFSAMIKRYNRLTNIVKLEILWEALDYMEQSNTRDKWDCVAIAMGYKVHYRVVDDILQVYYTKTA